MNKFTISDNNKFRSIKHSSLIIVENIVLKSGVVMNFFEKFDFNKQTTDLIV